MHLAKTLLFALFSILFIQLLAAQEDNFSGRQLQEWYYLVDSINKVPPSEILLRKNEFTALPVGGITPNSSYTYWLYLEDYEAANKKDTYLTFGDFDQMWLYGIIDQKIGDEQANGRLIKPGERAVMGIPYGFIFDSQAEGILAKVKNYFFQEEQMIDPQFVTSAQFIKHQLEQQKARKNNVLFLGVLLGILFPFLISATTFYLLRRKLYYLYWSLYVFSTMVITLYFFEKYSHIDVFFSFYPSISIYFERLLSIPQFVFFLLVLHSFLDLPPKLAWFKKVLRGFLGYIIVINTLDFVVVLLFGQTNWMFSFLNIAVAPLFIFTPMLIVILLRLKKLETNLVLLGFGFFITGIVMSILELQHISFFSNNLILENYMIPLCIGSILDVACFSLAITFKDRQSEERKVASLAQLQSTHHLQEAKNKLYQNLTHEFRTPLSNILNMADLIERQPTEDLEEKLYRIEQNGQNLLGLVNQMLDLAHLDAGAIRLNLKKGNLIGLLKYVVEAFQYKAKQGQIKLHFESDLEELWLDFDPTRLQQIISNLLSNAIKFTPKDGQITCAVKVVNSNDVSIKVSDTGIGIPKSDIPHLFERFFQVEKHRKNNQIGTGLGLSIVKELVELMEGEILVDSEEGRGTSFHIHLPIVNRTNVPEIDDFDINSQVEEFKKDKTTSSDSQVPSEETATMLIVEDNEDVVFYLKVLYGDSYTILSASDGELGLKMAIEHVPDIILSDIMIPKLNGLTMCQMLKRDIRTSHIPIILLSAKSSPQEIAKGIEMGADAYLPKPFFEEELSLRIANALSARQQLTQYFRSQDLLPSFWNGKMDKDICFYGQLAKLIEDNLDSSSLDIAFLCKELYMSRTQLYRKVKAITDKPVAHLIRDIRLKKAKYLLENTSDTIQYICVQIGIKDTSHFAQIFQKEFGLMPSEYRRANRRSDDRRRRTG